MKKVLMYLMILLLGCVPYLPAKSLDLNAYLDIVRQHNKDLQLAEKDRKLADIQKKQAMASALPAVAAEAGYTRNITDYYMYFDATAFMPDAGGVIKAPIKRDNEYSATLALQQTLFSPNVISAIRAAGEYQKLSDYVYEASEQAIITGAKELFYQCLLLDIVTQVSDSAQANAKENYQIIKLRYDNGQASELELLQAETRWRGTIPNTEQAMRNYKLAMNTLKNLAGIDVNETIELDGDLKVVPAMPEQPQVSSVFQRRPDLNALQWEAKLRKTNVNAAKGAFLPTLTGQVAYAYTSQSNRWALDEENKLLFAGINLSFPIFTGGYRLAKIQQAQVELEQSRLRIEQKQESIDNELSNVYLRLQEANQRILSAKTTWQTAEKAFHITETTTKSGLTTQLELKDARLMYDQAKLGYYSAVFDYLTAYYDWEKATGQVN